jgi:tRNA1(Val) A37 N6-methylase TrmN6
VTLTEGTLLGGRVRYCQPAAGFRSGIEPVLLAAAVPARAGQTVLEGGTGAGAGLLCLLARVPGVRAVGIERDPALAAVATANISSNGLADQARILAADLLTADGPAMVDHAFANPPYHLADGTLPANEGRAAAKVAPDGIAPWIVALARRLRHRGTLTLALPAHRLSEAMTALRPARLGAAVLFPLWPRADVAAKLVLIQARRGGTGGDRLSAGLVLHDAGGFTAQAEAVLRQGHALDLRRS